MATHWVAAIVMVSTSDGQLSRLDVKNFGWSRIELSNIVLLVCLFTFSSSLSAFLFVVSPLPDRFVVTITCMALIYFWLELCLQKSHNDIIFSAVSKLHHQLTQRQALT